MGVAVRMACLDLMTRNPSRERRRRDRPTAYTNARLIDPASKTDVGGAVLIEGKIIDWGPALFSDGAPENVRIVDCQGYCSRPG